MYVVEIPNKKYAGNAEATAIEEVKHEARFPSQDLKKHFFLQKRAGALKRSKCHPIKPVPNMGMSQRVALLRLLHATTIHFAGQFWGMPH